MLFNFVNKIHLLIIFFKNLKILNLKTVNKKNFKVYFEEIRNNYNLLSIKT